MTNVGSEGIQVLEIPAIVYGGNSCHYHISEFRPDTGVCGMKLN